ncbi:MAG TPA: ABC transporter substrate-binding protein [Clostridia bacterium]|jgi:spermidine/putrescine transport system substrate-binding protein|nr:ABC transporter substrate-binding protein [Clostridiaceae bacterium]HOM35116.1 ABC transporter substrate-binding protein [Clostridia bacterium]HOT70919.1 ABC transporter substrate-binding protein [Clostridia bacterium]HQG00889.1 ABC transporter substrate-binding protein [Clostridia bacterium]HQH66033.1 ABC transporter substrate-binding protein [Clostridia bacterium]
MKKALVILLSVIMVLSFTGCAKDREVLNVYNWGEYIDMEVLDMFEEETGIKVNYNTFVTNEDMYVKLSKGRVSYDVIFPSDYMIQRMIDEDMLQKINMDNVPNYFNIADVHKNLSFDPDNEYSVPYLWGTVGILYNKTMVSDTVDSWDILWNEKYSQKIFMQDSQRDSMMVALIRLGYSQNTTDQNQVNQARDLLIAQKPLVLGYLVDEVKDKMVQGEGALAVVWSGEAVAAMELNEDLAFVIPKEGSNRWVDSMVIPKNAKNVSAAEKFINFMLRDDIMVMNANETGYSITSKTAIELLDEDWRNNLVAFPTEEMMSECEFFEYNAEATVMYNKAWTEVTAN